MLVWLNFIIIMKYQKNGKQNTKKRLDLQKKLCLLRKGDNKPRHFSSAEPPHPNLYTGPCTGSNLYFHLQSSRILLPHDTCPCTEFYTFCPQPILDGGLV